MSYILSIGCNKVKQCQIRIIHTRLRKFVNQMQEIEVNQHTAGKVTNQIDKEWSVAYTKKYTLAQIQCKWKISTCFDNIEIDATQCVYASISVVLSMAFNQLSRLNHLPWHGMSCVSCACDKWMPSQLNEYRMRFFSIDENVNENNEMNWKNQQHQQLQSLGFYCHSSDPMVFGIYHRIKLLVCNGNGVGWETQAETLGENVFSMNMNFIRYILSHSMMEHKTTIPFTTLVFSQCLPINWVEQMQGS